MDDIVVLAITMMTLGQIVFCVPQLLVRAQQTQTYFPLALFFVANAIIALGPAVTFLAPQWKTFYIAMMFPSWLLLGPMIWFYVEGLTSNTPWRIKTKHAYQLIPCSLGLIVTGLFISLPLATRKYIFSPEADINSGFPLVVVISIFLLMVLWAAQSSYYVIRVIFRLSRYRKQLKELFASNEQRELGWLSWVLIIISSTWLFSFISLMLAFAKDDSLFEYRFGFSLLLALVWSLAYWGLRQKPGFEGRYEKDKLSPEVEPSESTKKYERSALSNEQAQRIAAKIKAAMEQDQLYLDSNLSLHKLATHLAIPANYISQTLNETMATNFFDFVNKCRVEAAKPKIIANEDTVLNIALEVGFNARSSFYKVFKKETGNTPTDYRKLHCNK